MDERTSTPAAGTDPTLDRRKLLRRASAAAVAAAGAASVAAATPAGANTNDPILAGRTDNTAQAPTGLRVDFPATAYGFGVTDGPLNSFDAAATINAHAGLKFLNAISAEAYAAIPTTGIRSKAVSPEAHAGVFSATGDGSVGLSALAFSSTSVTEGVGVMAVGGRANLHLVPDGDPHDEFWDPQVGDVVCDSTGNLSFATFGPSGVRYTRLAGPQTGGAFHPITPTRSVDTRQEGGPLSAQQTRVADLAVNTGGGALVPLEARAAVINVTVVGTQGSGFLTLWPFGVARPAAPTNNCSASG